jgi:hypothetical protein
MRTPRWRYRIYQLGLVGLRLSFRLSASLAHVWSLWMLAGDDRAEYLVAFERGRQQAAELARRL